MECRVCHRNLSSKEFYKCRRDPSKQYSRCISCDRIACAVGRNKLRKDVIDAYGGTCRCCNETNLEFLGIDHIDGDGNKHRREVGGGGRNFYLWLKKNKYPSGFQVLCHNCNMANGFYGYCPHQSTRSYQYGTTQETQKGRAS